MQREATLALTNIESKNAMQDNMRQMLVAMDTHEQKWAEIYIKAAKDGVEPPLKPDLMTMMQTAYQYVSSDASAPIKAPKVETQDSEPAAAIMSQDGALH